MTIGWGIVSTGRHPDEKVVPAMRRAADTLLVAVYSRDIARAEAFAQKHGISAAYDSLDAMAQDPGVDAVFISSPNSLHAEHTRIAAQAGKHVLVEKPMAVSLDEAEAMVRQCREAGVKLGVGFHLRYHPGHQKVRKLLADNVLGTVSLVHAQWAMGARGRMGAPPRSGASLWWDDPEMVGGASTLMGTGVHLMDHLYFLLGQPIVEVAAITDGQTDRSPLEQLAVVSLRLADGTIGSITCGRRMPDTVNDAIIYGSHGRIWLKETLWEAQGGALEVTSETQNLSESYESDRLAMYQAQTEAFNHAVEHDQPFHASGEDGARVVRVTLAIIESARTGRTVKVAY